MLTFRYVTKQGTAFVFDILEASNLHIVMQWHIYADDQLVAQAQVRRMVTQLNEGQLHVV